MGLLQSYSVFVLKHPARILAAGISSVIILFLLTLTIKTIPSFKDPLVGFEARNTLIASRLNTWRLLVDETSASAHNLSLGPNSDQYEPSLRHDYTNNGIFPSDHSTGISPIRDASSNKLIDPVLVEMSTAQGSGHNKTSQLDEMDEDEDEYYRSVNSSSSDSTDLMHYSLDSSKPFCGQLYEEYAQAIVSPTMKHFSSGLLNLNSMIAVCQLDRRMRLEHSVDDNLVFQGSCERFRVGEDRWANESTKMGSACCNSWSLPNYIACLSNKTNCLSIDQHDLKNFESLLHLCVPYYHKSPFEDCFIASSRSSNSPIASTLNILTTAHHESDVWPKPQCGVVPEKCLKCDGWIYNVMHYLVNHNFMSNKQLTESDSTQKQGKSDRNHRISPQGNRLTHTSIFLPIAKSPTLMKYYHTLTKHSLKTPFAQVKAMDLGLKSSLFERLLSDDTKLFVIALVAILMVISIYAWSVLLPFVVVMIICLSLCLSFTIYELVLNIPVFPFMNLLAIVISFGICSDNAMLFCKHWDQQGDPVTNNSTGSSQLNKRFSFEQANLDRVLRRAIVSTSIATLATACSFIISIISQVTAVRCFCIFATLSVVTNYILVVLLLPPALVLDSRLSEYLSSSLNSAGPKYVKLIEIVQLIRSKLLLVDYSYKAWILKVIMWFRLYLMITFVTLLLCSSVLVFYRPTLQPSDQDKVQLLSSKHTFEQYDRSLKKQFAFERFKYGDTASSKSIHGHIDTLPVRIVFGLKPIDNGNPLDPHDRGSLVFDPKFDLTDPDAQTWLLDFCAKLRKQRFIRQSSSPEIANCFIETFKTWIETRNCRDPIQPEVDRSPCCQAYSFPFSRSTFNKCVGEAISIIRKTPTVSPNSNSGVRFFKNSTKIAAIIIEYSSNRGFVESFSKMERFYNHIDEWVTWQINNTAPPSLKSGWFISSNLELLALQTELEQSTSMSIIIEVLFATIALMISTRDLVLTIAGSLTIATIIIVTVASLILLKWTLGIAESIMISLTIGLSIDFALHYSVAYNESKRAGSNSAIIHWILDQVGGPIALATVTTSSAGFVIIWSEILAYQELGLFLVLIALVSWSTSTFFLLPMLSTVITLKEQSQYLNLDLVSHRLLKWLIDRL